MIVSGLLTYCFGNFFTLLIDDEKNKANTCKAGYTANPVVCGWAGAVLEKVTRALGRSSELKNAK